MDDPIDLLDALDLDLDVVLDPVTSKHLSRESGLNEWGASCSVEVDQPCLLLADRDAPLP